MKHLEEKVLGTIGVDSGQVMIIDPCYAWDDMFTMSGDPTGGPYDEACRATCYTPHHYGGIKGTTDCDNAGFACGTLHGDGEYPVIALVDEQGRIHSITIDFDDAGWNDEPEDEEDDEPDWDDRGEDE